MAIRACVEGQFGGALRGASIAYGESLHKLQTLFCEPDTEFYNPATRRYRLLHGYYGTLQK